MEITWLYRDSPALSSAVAQCVLDALKHCDTPYEYVEMLSLVCDMKVSRGFHIAPYSDGDAMVFDEYHYQKSIYIEENSQYDLSPYAVRS